ncbi:MAG: Asp-tRNA(Asn)/Glu-tRNA(Gln) amidotransferase subunit GatC [Patescibacteria group bacterium]|jgi:aspartyl-tRNA(Asn)/glutamyl-tRNA(Gln) amidotransferase subunit C
MSITKEEIKKIAQLARLELNDVEIAKYQKQFSSILGYIDQIKDVRISDLDILGLNSEIVNQTRVDEVFPGEPEDKKLALDQAPEREADQIKVGRVI